MMCYLVFSPQNTFTLLDFKYLVFQRTWWRVSQKRVVCTTFDIYVRIMCVQHSLIYYLQWLATEKLVYYGEYIIVVKTIRSLHVIFNSIVFISRIYLWGLVASLGEMKNKTGLSERLRKTFIFTNSSLLLNYRTSISLLRTPCFTLAPLRVRVTFIVLSFNLYLCYTGKTCACCVTL